MTSDNESERNPRQRTITITVDESDDRMRAIAQMDWHDRKLVGVGRARPGEQFPDRAAEKLSVTRALSDLVARLNTSPVDATW
jgi:hypothetical protein